MFTQCIFPNFREHVGPELVCCSQEAYSVRLLPRNSVAIRPAGLEAPGKIGRVPRRGAMLKEMMSKVIKDTHASSRESMDLVPSE